MISFDCGIAVTMVWPYCSFRRSASGNGTRRHDGQIVGEMCAADGQRIGVHDGAFEQHGDLCRCGADIEHANTQLAFVGGEHSFCGGDGFENCVGDFNAGLVGAGDDVLHGAGRSHDDVEIYFQRAAHHADGIENSFLFVD